MKKEAFSNGSIQPKKTVVVKTQKQKLVERLENITSLLDFYNQKQKIIECLRETR